MNTVRTMPCLAGSTDECLSLSPLEDLLRPVFDYHLPPNLVFFPFLPLPHHRRSIWGPAGHICIKCSPYFFLGPTADSLLEVVDYNTVGFRLASSAVETLVFPDLLMWCANLINWYTVCKCRWMSLTNLKWVGLPTLRHGMLLNTYCVDFFGKHDALIATHYCVWVSEVLFATDNTRRKRMLVM